MLLGLAGAWQFWQARIGIGAVYSRDTPRSDPVSSLNAANSPNSPVGFAVNALGRGLVALRTGLFGLPDGWPSLPPVVDSEPVVLVLEGCVIFTTL